MAKQKENLPVGFLVTVLSSDECRLCALEVRCANEAQKIEELRELARQACQMALTDPNILYLDRRQIPWEEIRRRERSVTSSVASECSDYSKIEEQVLSLMSKWYGEVCLMEHELTDKANFGLRLARLNKEHGLEASFTNLVIVQA
ncbi:MAG: hypothetical protein ACI38Q_08820 [Candidatus Bruticola sp.]